MTSTEALTAMLDALDSVRAQYMLVGSLSSNFYGVPRATADADIVVCLEPAAIADLRERLRDRLRMEPQLTFETITATRRYVFRLPDASFAVELFLLGDDEYDQERFRRRRAVQMLGRSMYVPAVEDVIVTKLRWAQHGARRKDLDDLQGVVSLQRDHVDWDYVQRWCDRQGTRAVLEELLRCNPYC